MPMNAYPELVEEFQIDVNARSCAKPWSYSRHMLQKVSRTFALNIEVLPKGVLRPVLLAYLFCRMADTVEDDPYLSGTEKEALLDGFRDIFLSGNWRTKALDFVDSLPKNWADSKQIDQVLTTYPEWSLGLYFDLDPRMIQATSPWIDEMCKGMKQYSLRREENQGWLKLETVEELDDYCYYVAGTVGYMLTDLFGVYTSLISSEKKEEMKSLCNSFGLGLQITNIIKDIHEDYQRETSYVPAEFLSEVGLDHDSFLDPAQVDVAYKVIRKMSIKAMGHLEDALNYTLLIPRLEPRLRLFCLWPLFLATATLAKVLESGTVLTAEKVKLTRPEVKRILKRTTWACIFDKKLRNIFAEESARIRTFIGDES